MRAVRLAALAVAVACVVMAPLGAAGPGAVRTPARAGATAGSGGATSVLGVAWRVDNTPIPGARVQLRNLVSGKVDSTAFTDNVGQFTFSRLEGGTYAVELLGENGKVVTVGQAFVIGQGETVATFVRLGTKVPWYTGFFNNAAAAVAASAASQGITAIAPVQLSLSNGS
jgi:hypothetical protein